MVALGWRLRLYLCRDHFLLPQKVNTALFPHVVSFSKSEAVVLHCPHDRQTENNT